MTNNFNWDFYEAVSRLKLLHLKKKSSLKVDDYGVVPVLIQKEMDKYAVNSDFDRFRLKMIKNEYL